MTVNLFSATIAAVRTLSPLLRDILRPRGMPDVLEARASRLIVGGQQCAGALR